MSQLSDEELKVLKEMIKREEAVGWLWGWIKSFLFVAVGGLLSIWTLIELWRNTK
jgi:hypothetical protein